MYYDELLIKIKEYGKYQMYITFLGSLPWLIIGFNHLGIIFIGDTPDFFCQSSVSQSNQTYIHGHNSSIYLNPYTNGSRSDYDDQCYIFTSNLTYRKYDSYGGQHLEKCSKWSYDRSQYTATIVTKVR